MCSFFDINRKFMYIRNTIYTYIVHLYLYIYIYKVFTSDIHVMYRRRMYQ